MSQVPQVFARPMQEPIVLKQSLWIALVAALQFMTPPLIVVGCLYLSAALFGVHIDDTYGALAGIAGALAVVALRLPAELSVQFSGRAQSAAITVIAGWALVVALLLLLGYVTKSSSYFSRRVIGAWLVLTPAALYLSNLLLVSAYSRFVQREGTRRAVFAGFNEVSQSLASRLASHPQWGVKVVGFFDDRSVERLNMGADARLIGGLSDLASFAKDNAIGVIFVALPIRHVQRVLDLLDDLKDTTTSIYYVPDFFLSDLIQSRSGEVAGIPVIAMCETPFFGYRGVIKRLTDVVLASIFLVVVLPVLFLVAVLVKATSAGPVIFRQRRYGLDGAEIVVYKFRTMKVTEDGERVVQATVGDPRVTPVGAFLRRYSIDELPQLVNVIQGRMSLVGPRPHAVAHNEQYRKLIKGYMVRHKVLPGITGLAQVNGCRGETADIEQMKARVDYDLQYLRHWSLAMDLGILLKTVLMLLRDKKAY